MFILQLQQVRMDHAKVVQGQLGAAQDANAKLESRIVNMELEVIVQ